MGRGGGGNPERRAFSNTELADLFICTNPQYFNFIIIIINFSSNFGAKATWKNLERFHMRRLTPNRGGVQPDRGEVRLCAAGGAQVLPQPGRQSILRLSQGGQEL